eukprot:s2953_g7.t1
MEEAEEEQRVEDDVLERINPASREGELIRIIRHLQAQVNEAMAYEHFNDAADVQATLASSIPEAKHSLRMVSETFLFTFIFCLLVRGRGVCDTHLTCDETALLQHDSAFLTGRHGTWALPRDWKTTRDIANVSGFETITWGRIGNQDMLLKFFSAIPVFGQDGNYIALLHDMGDGLQLKYLETGELSLFCSGPDRSHRTKVRGLGNENHALYKKHFVFLCDWPEEEKHLERFEVFFEDGHGKHLGIVVAEQKNGLLQQYRTAVCLRDVWPDEKVGLRQLPQWMEFHLLHGVEHFLIYTINIDSKILVDLYEPYIKSGVATRVHFNKERVGEGWQNTKMGNSIQLPNKLR